MKIPTPVYRAPEPEGEWGRKVKNILDRRTSVSLSTGCWEWEGAKTSGGYGHLQIDHVLYDVHRLSAMLFLGYGPEFAHLDVLHKPDCPNKHCWNPEHLYIGTHQQNMLDRVETGTATNQNTDATHCKRGHEFTPENTYHFTSPNGNPRRSCKVCMKINSRKGYEKKRLLKFGEGA